MLIAFGTVNPFALLFATLAFAITYFGGLLLLTAWASASPYEVYLKHIDWLVQSGSVATLSSIAYLIPGLIVWLCTDSQLKHGVLAGLIVVSLVTLPPLVVVKPDFAGSLSLFVLQSTTLQGSFAEFLAQATVCLAICLLGAASGSFLAKRQRYSSRLLALHK